jgi:hypothetical protein
MFVSSALHDSPFLEKAVDQLLDGGGMGIDKEFNEFYV